MNRRHFLATATLPVLPTELPAATQAGPLEVGNRRELFVDRFLIDKLDGASLRLHEPRSEGAVLQLDRPWEGPHCCYTTILKDTDRYRLYYRGTTRDLKREFTCIAESRDGIAWTRPNLGLVEFNGSKDNNLILADRVECHNFTPFLDPCPGVPSAERYKALGGQIHRNPAGGLTAWASADGVRWRKLHEQAVITKGAFDSQNVAFWSETEQCYVAYFRTFSAGVSTATEWRLDGVRTISRATSTDFLRWSDTVPMTFGDTLPEHLYTNATTPYFRAPHIYLAMPSRYLAGKDAVTSEQQAQLGVSPLLRRKGEGFNDIPLMSSRGGSRYDRTFMEAFIRPGLGLKNWTSRANYPACGLVPCTDDPTRLAIYLNRHVGYRSAYIERMTLRLDGFASVNASYRGGEMLSKPLKFEGTRLTVNYSTSAAGHLRVEVQDLNGKPLPGFALAECPEHIGDELDRTVTWKNGPDLGSLAGGPVRLRFVMKDADLFALQFRRRSS